jgi:hypothetical protein
MKYISITPENISEYKKTIETQHMPALVKIYSPDCWHCNAMKPAWKALEKDSAITNMNIAIIEVRNDALESLKHETVKNIDGYPTIRFIENGKIKNEYDGATRETKDMVKFIKENLGAQQKGGRTHARKRTRGRKHLQHKKTRKTRKTRKIKTRK